MTPAIATTPGWLIPLLMGYVALGVLSNLLSLRHARRTGRRLTPVNPVAGLAAMLAYCLAAALHLAGQPPGTWLLAALLLLIAYAGVCRHLLAGDPQAYTSPISRWSAIAINAFGVGIGLAALFSS